ncbi:MAG: Gfo/Idh/MocA family protein [Acidimicrobiales bacterium]
MSSPSEPLRIGVLAPTSTVARLAVIPAIAASPSCRLEAVASLSDPDWRGEPPGSSWPSVRRHATYADLLEDPGIEAVYVPLPNSMHREWVERSAAAGKHVLCEKPLAPSPEDAVAMATACAEAGVVLMEAYMSPFHPRSRSVLAAVGSGRLGRLLYGAAVFTGTLSRPEDHRWRPEMGGGALLDLGIYCLTPLLEAAGVGGGPVVGGSGPATPDDVVIWRAWASRAPLGVDATFEGTLGLGAGVTGLLRCSFEAGECQRLTLAGTEATLVVDRAFTPSLADTDFRLVAPDGSVETVRTEGGDPYTAMVQHFAAVARGSVEVERPPSKSVAMAHLLARLDEQSRH